jgi:hypothetical protein
MIKANNWAAADLAGTSACRGMTSPQPARQQSQLFGGEVVDVAIPYTVESRCPACNATDTFVIGQ